ncbi:uncharacterized protein [Aegilops tauschii subsp. strangulata]|uniref:uncharacterized protein n=1 Tax=Aegilops tauschii subsp. strangulata TaxID=200361 RepID=UPI003CC8CF08
MADSPACRLCGAADSWRHVLLECTMARSIWALAPESLVEHMSINENPNTRRWLFNMQSLLNHTEFTRLGVTLWAIWSSRRKVIYEDIYQTPFATNAFVNSFINGLQLLTKPRGEQVVVQARPNRWIAPPENLVKINVDAALLRNRSVGTVAAVCRGRDEVFMGASTVTFIGTNEPTALEALAMREALALADDLYERRILVASDCKVVIDNIKVNNAASYRAIIREIIDRSSSFLVCSFSHEFRSLNTKAHNLAKRALPLGVGRVCG